MKPRHLHLVEKQPPRRREPGLLDKLRMAAMVVLVFALLLLALSAWRRR